MLDYETLTQIANENELTTQQREVLFRRIIEKKSYRQIAKDLDTSENACQKCMGEVYKKFGITGETRGKERRLILTINSTSDRHKLGSVSFPEIMGKLDSLSQAIKKENELNATINEVSKIIPILVDSAARISNRGKSEVSQKILASLKESYLKTVKRPLPPVIERNFQFLLSGEHAIARSLFAFINRTLKQVNIENHSPALIIKQAIDEIISAPSHTMDLEKAPSATLRKFCLEQILKIRSQPSSKESNQEGISVNEECLIKNMKVIRYVLDELHKQGSEKNQINFKILEYRYDQGLSYEQIARDWEYPSEISNIQERIDRLKEMENNTLKNIRHQFHKIIESEKLKDCLKEVKQTEIIRCYQPDVKEKIELYSKIATYKTLTDSNIQYLQLIIADSIRTPLIDFWINEIDHFIAHEREDLTSSEDHKLFEARQKNELIKKILNEGFISNQQPELTIATWKVKNFRVYCSYQESVEAEVILWNPKTKKQFTGLASSNGSIDALCLALKNSLNQALQSLGKKTCPYALYSVNLQSQIDLDTFNQNEGRDSDVSATIILQCGDHFYVGKETHIDSIQAAFYACVSAINKILENLPIPIKELAQNVMGTNKIKIFGNLRIDKTIELLRAKKSPIYAVSSGDIIKWWNSDLGQRFKEINKEIVAQGISIQRVFIVDQLGEAVKQVIGEQRRDGLEVRYLLKEEMANLEELDFKGLAEENLLVCEEEFTTRMAVDNKGEEKDGFISWDQGDIRSNKERFKLIWDKAISWDTQGKIAL